jgi:hypothetical protein
MENTETHNLISGSSKNCKLRECKGSRQQLGDWRRLPEKLTSELRQLDEELIQTRGLRKAF